jgi:hypothetical protein
MSYLNSNINITNVLDDIITGYTENLEIGFEGSASSFGRIVTAFYGGLWAYDGW